MSPLLAQSAASNRAEQCPLCPNTSDFDLLSDGKRIIDLNSEISDGTFHFPHADCRCDGRSRSPSCGGASAWQRCAGPIRCPRSILRRAAHSAVLSWPGGTFESWRSMYPMGILLLVLFTESLDVRFAVRIEEVLAALLPRRLEFGRRDVPVWPAFLGNGTKVLAEISHSGPAEVPVAVVDLIDDETGLEDNHMGDHRIVDRIRILGDVEIFLDDTPLV